MKKTVALVALAGLLCLGGSALANIGTADVVPAATLLIPRFEVDLANANGVTTLFSINNASAESVLAHVTLWTEWWIPILDFDVYLTGYDVQTINVRDLLNGNLPRTGTSTPPFPPVGAFSAPHQLFPGCSNSVGPTNYAPLAPSQVALLQQAFSGQPIQALGGTCASDPTGDLTLARGYVTIDSVSFCSTEFPGDPGYFVDGGQGTANNNNVLWGDYFIVDNENNFAQGFTSVHIEADALVANVCDIVTGFPFTFYCSLTDTAADNREALGSIYATRYLAGGLFTGGTSVIAWRDPLTGANNPVPCNNVPFSRTPQNQLVRFDEEENPLVPEGGGPSIPDIPLDERPFPWCTNRAIVGQDLVVDADFGWLYLNLNVAPTFNQAYVTVVMDAEGRFSVGFDGLQLNGLTNGDGRNVNPLLGTATLPTLSATPSLFQP